MIHCSYLLHLIFNPQYKNRFNIDEYAILIIVTHILHVLKDSKIVVKLIHGLYLSVKLIFWPHFAVTTMATSVKMKDRVLLTTVDQFVIKALARSNHANKIV